MQRRFEAELKAGLSSKAVLRHGAPGLSLLYLRDITPPDIATTASDRGGIPFSITPASVVAAMTWWIL